MRAWFFSAVLLTASIAAADEIDDLARAVEKSPDDPKAYDTYAMAAFKAKKFDDAIRKLKVGVARIADYSEGYYKLAYAYRQKKEWADAADYYRRYTTLNPKRTDTYFGLGASLQGLGDTKGAIAAYDKYVSLEKDPAKQKFVDVAKAELVKLDPARAPAVQATIAPSQSAPVDPYRSAPPPAGPPRSDAPALRAQAEDLQKQGKLDEAAIAFQRAIEADRGNLELYNSLGNVYFSLKKYDQAAQAFRDATARDPNFALGWYNLAHALRKGQKHSDAVAAYKQYMRLRPDDPDPYYGLGQTYKALGDVPGAIDAFRKYVTMEKRPDEQKWVDKARIELEKLEALQRSLNPAGRIDEKASEDRSLRAAREELDRALQRDSVLPMGEHHRQDDLIDPFVRNRSLGLRDPWAQPADYDTLLDPFSLSRPRTEDGARSDLARLRAYGAALAEFRRALSAQAEDVTLRLERGASLALADSNAALRAWDSVQLRNARVDAARRLVEKARSLIARR